jgi:hypothetical protein
MEKVKRMVKILSPWNNLVVLYYFRGIRGDTYDYSVINGHEGIKI